MALLSPRVASVLSPSCPPHQVLFSARFWTSQNTNQELKSFLMLLCCVSGLALLALVKSFYFQSLMARYSAPCYLPRKYISRENKLSWTHTNLLSDHPLNSEALGGGKNSSWKQSKDQNARSPNHPLLIH